MISASPSRPLLAVVGPTASGKSDTAIMIARHYDGEIISADSRQVYRGMVIGTGKVPRDPLPTEPFHSGGIRHHLIDIADPHQEYNISHFLHDAREAIRDIRSRKHLPIICGGTHFWIQTLLMGNVLPEVPPDPTLRLELSEKTSAELMLMLRECDSDRAASIDSHNTQRLIRAIEIARALGKSPALTTTGSMPYNALVIAMNPPSGMLRERIEKRLATRFDQGMIEEVRVLHEQRLVPWDRLDGFGLEYRYIARFLRQEIDEDTMRKQLFHASWHYARRQRSWLRRWERSGADIHWTVDGNTALALLDTWK